MLGERDQSRFRDVMDTVVAGCNAHPKRSLSEIGVATIGSSISLAEQCLGNNEAAVIALSIGGAGLVAQYFDGIIEGISQQRLHSTS